jgi:hypothetical protein
MNPNVRSALDPHGDEGAFRDLVRPIGVERAGV